MTDNFTSHGLALEVEETPVDRLFGPERDIGRGHVGIGDELDPAGAITWCQGDCAKCVMTRRRRAGTSARNRPEPSPAVRPISFRYNPMFSASMFSLLKMMMVGHRPSPTPPGTGFPWGSSTRPATIIRPGFARSALAARAG